MKYYQFSDAIGTKSIGSVWPQAEGVYPISVESPDFIANSVPDYSRIENDVVVPMARLRKKSTKLTDLLSAVSIGLNSRLLLSEKLKTILEKAKHLGFQFFSTKVFSFSGEYQYPYWLSNVYIFFPEYIDYSKSELWTETWDGKDEERIVCDSFEDYQKKNKLIAPRSIYVRKVVFLENEIEYDFFALNNIYGSIKYYVSEKLKNEIESAGCTGITFTEPYAIYP